MVWWVCLLVRSENCRFSSEEWSLLNCQSSVPSTTWTRLRVKQTTLIQVTPGSLPVPFGAIAGIVPLVPTLNMAALNILFILQEKRTISNLI